MTARKERLTVTVDRTLIEAGSAAVTAGRAESLSGWVNRAMAERAQKERRLEALAEAVAAYEAEFGEIGEAELDRQAHTDRQNAVVIRGHRRARSQRRRRGAA